MLEFFENQIGTIAIIAGFVSASVIVWKNRGKAAVTSVWQTLLIVVCLIFCGPLMVSFFWNASRFLMPGILQSGIFGPFLFAPFIMLAFARVTHRSTRDLLDLLACFLPIYQIFNRMSCYFTNCCKGYELFGTSVRWPARQLEQIFFLVAFVFLWQKCRKGEDRGLLFPYLTIGYGCFRFLNEWFSEGAKLVAGIQIAHIWSVLTIIIGLSMYFELTARKEKNSREHQYREGKT